MAHKKGQGSTANGRDSNPKYRGVKLFGGQVADWRDYNSSEGHYMETGL